MSSGTDAARKAALDHLRFKKREKSTPSSQITASTSTASSSIPPQSPYNTLPVQSRDATVSSRFFPHAPSTPAPTGRVLVPNSSPLGPEPAHNYHQNGYQPHPSDASSSLLPSNSWHGSHAPYGHDLLSAPSGYHSSSTSAHASFSRPSASNGYGTPPVDIPGRGEPPRKRINRGPSMSPDQLNLFNLPESPKAERRAPDSPDVQRPGQRRRLNNSVVLSSASDDESISEVASGLAGPSKPRIIRGQPPRPEPLSSEPSQSDLDEERFKTWKIQQPFFSTDDARAAWKQAGGDARRADALLSNPNWKPIVSSPPKAPAAPMETGRVKEVEEANKAEKARMREMGKKSMIYQGRSALEGKPTSKAGLPTVTPPVSRATIDLTKSPATPGSPEIVAKKGRRLKRKVLDSESEAEAESSDGVEVVGVRNSSPSTSGSASKKTLDYFNSATADALQELSGCSATQAAKIIELRPFSSFQDLSDKLGQGRKKAGPAGISSRMVEDCREIFEGYAAIDHILTKCESIGSKLKHEINTWTSGTPSVRPSRDVSAANSRGTSVASDLMDDGALALRSQASLAAKKPAYYISTQPPSLSEKLQLKDYQMIGINWLNLLYRKGHSCILADEMGLGKTVQVISFMAHLQERGAKGPHLVVVPSSTLENWVREFKRFAPGISVQTYYAGKEDRPVLRQTLRDTMRSKGDDDGWEVLLATYNLAQGDEHDRKFFKRIEWNVCVFDEGHVLKNFQSQRYQALMKYDAQWRLLLTGTPLQNNLQELVSLLNFILPPELIGSRMEELRAVFRAKGDSKVTLLAQERVSRAKKMLTPFVLRRRKDHVLKDLPKKSERIEWCEMTPLQKSIYNDALRRSRKTVFDLEEEEAEASPSSNTRGKQKKSRANARTKDKLYLENSANVLMDLRKAALHPMLFRRRYTDETLSSIARVLLKEPEYKKRGAIFQYVKEDMEVMTDAELQLFCTTYKSTRKYLQEEDCYIQAGKIKVLLSLLDTYQEDNRRVLIFSQFTQVLDILQKVLDQRRIKFLLLTGSTAVDVRQALVDEFTDDDSIPVFLLSTKAGGMGINLTAASVVIMFDQDFNPHNDKQAQDRAYRIGQKRDVEVVKLITKGSIEEDMLQLGMTKLALDEAVAGEEGGEKVEKEMKTTLMSVVRKKLEEVNEDPEEESLPVTASVDAASTSTSVVDAPSPLTDSDDDDKMDTDSGER